MESFRPIRERSMMRARDTQEKWLDLMIHVHDNRAKRLTLLNRRKITHNHTEATTTVPTYITLVRWTEEGAEAVQDAPKR